MPSSLPGLLLSLDAAASQAGACPTQAKLLAGLLPLLLLALPLLLLLLPLLLRPRSRHP